MKTKMFLLYFEEFSEMFSGYILLDPDGMMKWIVDAITDIGNLMFKWFFNNTEPHNCVDDIV